MAIEKVQKPTSKLQRSSKGTKSRVPVWQTQVMRVRCIDALIQRLFLIFWFVAVGKWPVVEIWHQFPRDFRDIWGWPGG
jgi:hypothetical protein